MTDPTPRVPLSRNPVSLAGAWLTTLAAFAFIGYLLAAWFDLFVSPYADLLGFVAIPAVFVLGLAVIPLGMWREARRRRRGHAAWQWPTVDLGLRRTRLVISVLTLLTIVNFEYDAYGRVVRQSSPFALPMGSAYSASFPSPTITPNSAPK